MKKQTFIPDNLHKILFYFFILFFTGCLLASDRENKIDSLMKYCFENNLFNGNVLVAENGKIIYENAFGIADIKTMEPLTLIHQFRLASVSKQFTAMAIMILKERNKLKYEDDIRNYFPELPYRGITICHLLTHTSGAPIYDDLFDEYWETNKNDNDKTIVDSEDILKMLVRYHPDVLFKPGEKWDYSNTGYDLLALIVSRVSGVPFEEFLKKNIFEPLGMQHTLVYSAKRKDPMVHRAYGFRMDLNGIDRVPNDYHYFNGVAGDDGVYSTVSDMLIWDRALYTDKLVSEASLKEAFTPVTLNDGTTYNYGFGWMIDTTFNGKRVVFHTGSWVGFRTIIVRDIDEDNTIIILSNNTSPYIRNIAKVVQDIIHGKSFVYPKIKISQIIGATLINSGIDEAISQYRELKLSKPDRYDFNEAELNSLGYNLINMDRLNDAIKIFKLNVENYPESYNTYDSLGDAYILNGNKKLAIENYKKSLALNPDNHNAIKKLNEFTK